MPSTFTERARSAALAAGAAYLVAAIQAAHLASETLPGRAQEILSADLLRLAVVILIAAGTGALYSERWGLVGMGDRARWVRSLGFAAGGAIASLTFYALVGREQAARFPAQYPCALQWALASWLKASIAEEVIARYGMMSLLVGLLRSRALGGIAQAVFFTLVSLRSVVGPGGGFELDGPVVAALASAFALHAAAGVVYARAGLVGAVLFHAATGLRLFLHPLVGCG